MRGVYSFSLLISALLHLTTIQAAGVPPVEAFGKIPQVSDVVLSPDGSLLAWQDASRSPSHLVVFDLVSSKYRIDAPMPDFLKVRALAWSDNETVLATASAYDDSGRWTNSAYRYEVVRTFSIDINTGANKMLLMRDGAKGAVTGADLLAYRTATPKTVIMATLDFSPTQHNRELGTRLAGRRADSGWVGRVFEVDVRTGNGRPIANGNSFTENWVVDAQGQVVARSDWNPETETYAILAKDGEGWRELLHEQHEGTRIIYGLSGDGKTILLSGRSDAGRRILVGLPLAGGALNTLLEDPAADVLYVLHDRFTLAPTCAALGGLDPRTYWLDKDAERQFNSVAKAFPGQQVQLYGRSQDNKRVVARVESQSKPPVYYLVDFKTGKADIVGEEYPGLADVKLGEVRSISYKARDGVEVPAYLTLPPASSGKNLPLVLLPHGGPELRDEPAFDWLAQFMAVRGYAVLQPQFRGSTGLGEAWSRAGYGQWGRLMQDDLTDGVKAMIEQGIADAGHVCIVGASYGGYAALAGAAFTPDLYKCAVSVGGISDLPAMLGYEKQHSGAESDAVAYWSDHIGSAFEPEVIAKSPARAAAQVKAPVMLMHANNDTVVPPAQSELMATALRKAGKPVTVVKLPGEDHWLSQTATRVQVLQELEKFLAANLRATP